MTVVETLLVFAAAPLAVVLLLAALTFLPGGRKRKVRYKPGQPWEHAPVWYEPHPEHAPADGGHGSPQTIGSSVYPELQTGDGRSAGAGAPALTAGAAATPQAAGDTGHGATAAAPPRDLGGPLGGARGTW